MWGSAKEIQGKGGYYVGIWIQGKGVLCMWDSARRYKVREATMLYVGMWIQGTGGTMHVGFC